MAGPASAHCPAPKEKAAPVRGDPSWDARRRGQSNSGPRGHAASGPAASQFRIREVKVRAWATLYGLCHTVPRPQAAFLKADAHARQAGKPAARCITRMRGGLLALRRWPPVPLDLRRDLLNCDLHRADQWRAEFRIKLGEGLMDTSLYFLDAFDDDVVLLGHWTISYSFYGQGWTGVEGTRHVRLWNAPDVRLRPEPDCDI